MKINRTIFDKIILRSKNNPITATLLITGVVIVSLASFTGSVYTLVDLFHYETPHDARIKLNQLSIEYSTGSFIKSVKANDHLVVKLFLKAGLDPDVRDNRGNTALIYALQSNFLTIIYDLLNHQADVNAVHKKGVYTIESAHTVETIQLLLDYGVTSKGINKVFVESAKYARLDVLFLLIDKITEYKLISEYALVAAATLKSYSVKQTSFLKEQISVINYLLDLGIDINAEDKIHWTALHYASYNKNKILVELLTKRGAKLNTVCDCQNKRYQGNTPLMFAVSQGDFKIVSYLLKQNVDVNIKNFAGETALMIAAKSIKGENKIFLALLVAGANVKDTNKEGDTVLSILDARGKKELLKEIKLLMKQQKSKDRLDS